LKCLLCAESSKVETGVDWLVGSCKLFVLVFVGYFEFVVLVDRNKFTHLFKAVLCDSSAEFSFIDASFQFGLSKAVCFSF